MKSSSLGQLGSDALSHEEIQELSISNGSGIEWPTVNPTHTSRRSRNSSIGGNQNSRFQEKNLE